MSKQVKKGLVHSNHASVLPQNYDSTTIIDKNIKRKGSRKIFLSTSPNVKNNTLSLQYLQEIKKKTCIEASKGCKKILNDFPSSTSYFDKSRMSSISLINSEYTYQKDAKKGKKRVEIEDMMKKINLESDQNKKIDSFKDILDEIIAQSKSYGPILAIIKQEFERVIADQSYTIQEHQKRIHILDSENKQLESKINNLSDKIKDLVLQLNQAENKLVEMTSNLLNLNNIERGNFEQSKENWDKALQQNRVYEEMLKESTVKINYYKNKYCKLADLIKLVDNENISIRAAYVMLKDVITDNKDLNSEDKETNGWDKKNDCYMMKY
ncbi:hypothetical protein SteCoe_28774 [Stentor coeruleus]|uniref:Translin-associated factor X-interacting protein 1 N-terminal domain-containing protein n=1 Tax=Stentor coeruleus TaxID=5963 RepID=A0A1R2B7F2_9CILI|nr:hypothetical protein SteCoe_28774 [Stentor coeruleus]